MNNDLKVSEKFVGFYEILDLKSSTIVTVMKDILLRFQLNLDLCRSQRYGGASNIFGKSSGCCHLDFYRTTKRTLSTFWSQFWSQIFSHTDNLSKTLQAKKMSAFSSKRLVELTIQVLQNMRNAHSFDLFYHIVAKKSTKCKFLKDPFNPRKSKSQNYSTVHLYIIDGITSETVHLIDGITSEAQDSHPTTCQNH